MHELAAHRGVEPRFSGSEPGVLPLDERAMSGAPGPNRTGVGGLQGRCTTTMLQGQLGWPTRIELAMTVSQTAVFTSSPRPPLGHRGAKQPQGRPSFEGGVWPIWLLTFRCPQRPAENPVAHHRRVRNRQRPPSWSTAPELNRVMWFCRPLPLPSGSRCKFWRECKELNPI